MTRPGAAVVLLVVLLGACSVDSWNAVRSTRAQGELDALDTRLVEHRQEVERRRAELRDLGDERRDLEAEITGLRQTRDRRAAELDRALATQQALEEDLAAAEARAAEIREALEPLRALEARLEQREQRIQQVTGEIAAQDAALQKLEQQLATRREEVAAQRAELQGRLEQLEAAADTVRQALEATAALFPAEPEAAAEGENQDGDAASGDGEAPAEKK